MSYKKLVKNYLQTNGISIGDIVKIDKEDISYKGIILDRPEDDDGDEYLVLKLDSGYNIGVNIVNTTAELIEKGDKPQINYAGEFIKNDPSKMDISIISTGGTVSSIIDYKTGAVHPSFTAEDLVRSNPEMPIIM